MNYSLGNNLSRGGAVNPDGLELDLAFAADKTLTARRGPTPTFTRGSGATQVNASGLIEYAPENLLLRSDDFGNATWQKFLASVTTNTAVSPSGITDADTLIETATTGQHYTFQQIAKETGSVTYCFSVYYKNAIGTRNLMLALTNGTSSGKAIIFTTSGAITATNLNVGSGAGFTFISANVDTLSGGWYRASIVIASDSANRLDAVAYLNTSATSVSSYAGDGVSGIYLWGAQLERHTSARAYIPTTTAAVYGARFDHDPVTLASRGLLIEEARTNSLLRSDDFNDGAWSPGAGRNLSVTVNNTTSPSGATDADLLTVGATTTTYQVLQGGPTFVSGTAYTFSCYLKANQVTRVSLYSGNAATYPVDAYFDLTGNGSVTANAAGTASIQKLANGWYRCVVTGTAGATAITTLRISPATAGNSRTYVGNSTDSFWAWGAQLELGSFPTSYIPTTTASVVRSADVCSITGSDFSGFYNQSEGTMLTVSTPAAVAGTTIILGLSNGTSNERWLNRFAQNEQAVITSAGTESGLDALNPVAGQQYKVAVAAKLNDVAMSINGSSVVTDFSQPMPIVTRMGIGNSTGTNIGGGMTIASIRYYKKRLTNAKLQSLTT